jgi:PIN domain nuclease of toxin-antitoxin system
MRYILDTHTLVWYFAKDERLSPKVKKVLQEAEKGKHEIIIPAIVLLETIDIQEKKKVKFKMEKVFDFIEAKENFKIADLNFLLIRQIPGRAKGLDLHDRVIVTVSKIYEGIILTKDSEIRKFATTIW